MGTEDKRFYGLYLGIVIDSDDPTNRGRVKLQVPQVTGQAITDWSPQLGGQSAEAAMPYGVFSSLTNQTVTGANTETLITYDHTEDAQGVYYDPAHPSRLYVNETGDYFWQFSAVFTTSSSSAKEADVWAVKNGTNIPRSNTRIVMQGNPNYQVMTVSFIVDLQAGDYVELAMSSSYAGTTLTAVTGLTGPTRPDIPSIITSLNLIGNYKPKPSTTVGVMYLAGDPNFPVWMGGYL